MAACLAVYDDAEDARNINIWAAEPMRSLTLDSTELRSARLLGVRSGAFACSVSGLVPWPVPFEDRFTVSELFGLL